MSGLRANHPQHLLDSYGCTNEFWIELRNIGLRMIEAGASKDATPLRAFQHQRHAAVVRRKIAWRLTLPQWWAVWQESGRWADRGIGRGYMMCRVGDVGAYELGNVFIGPGVENLSAATKKHDLPIGVSRTSKSRVNPYRAYCNVGGRQRHLGSFPTIEAAERAYLAALSLDLARRPA